MEAEREIQELMRRTDRLQEDLDTANATVASLMDTNEVYVHVIGNRAL